jgi:Mn-dependent DtxR family transcriptional regulator
VARLWALIQIYRHNQVFGSARLTDIADRLQVPCEVLEPTFDRLIDTGYVLRTGICCG